MHEGIGEEEDFKSGVWPFGGEGKSDDVLAPTGAECMSISKLLGRGSDQAGMYSFGGQADLLPAVPGLAMKGIGAIPLPLNSAQAQKLVENYLMVPEIGRAADNDTTKRGQLQSDQVEFENPTWHSGMEKMMETIAGRLGYKGVSLQWKLSKLLVHGEGGHIEWHHDTDKESGMVATMVVQLPSLYEGGDLVLYHGGKEKTRQHFASFDRTGAYLPRYAVICAGADFELEKVTKGYRLSLLYCISLPPSLRHLERIYENPLCEDLACVINAVGPEEASFALLLTYKYSKKSIEELGAGALEDIDYARYHALEEANAFVSADKHLRFFIVELQQLINYAGDGYDWDERNRTESSTWYATSGEMLGHVSASKRGLNLLNPALETLSERWIPYSKSIEEGCLGYRGAWKATTYSRYAIAAWPAVRHAENALKFMPLESAVESVLASRPMDAPTLRTFWEAVWSKITAENELLMYCYKPRIVQLPVRFCRAYCELLVDVGDLTLVNDFLACGCPRLVGSDENETLVPHLTTLVRTFDWDGIGSAVLELTKPSCWSKAEGTDCTEVEMTLRVIDALDRGTAQQTLLAQAVESALEIDTMELFSSKAGTLLWKWSICCGDKRHFDAVADKCKELEPKHLGPTVGAFSRYVSEISRTDERVAVLNAYGGKRMEWLKHQIEELGKPFSWEMPDADFADNATIQSFLRGADKSMKTTRAVHSFKGFQEARNLAAKWTREKQSNASFEMEASSTDGNAVVTVTKTRKWFMEGQQKLQEYEDELGRLAETFDGDTDENAKKRARLA